MTFLSTRLFAAGKVITHARLLLRYRLRKKLSLQFLQFLSDIKTLEYYMNKLTTLKY